MHESKPTHSKKKVMKVVVSHVQQQVDEQQLQPLDVDFNAKFGWFWAVNRNAETDLFLIKWINKKNLFSQGFYSNNKCGCTSWLV